MNIAAFYSDVRTAIGRGSANDAQFPAWAFEALNVLENEHTYAWMRKTTLYPLTPGTNSNVVPLGSTAVKAIDWVRYGSITGTGGSVTTLFSDPLAIVTPDKFLSIDNGTATAAYLDGTDTIVLDALPTEAASLYVRAFYFSAWPADTTQTPPVLARHYHGFKAHFMMTVAANLRDSDLGQIWQGVAQRGIQAMLAADGVSEWAARRQLRMGGAQ